MSTTKIDPIIEILKREFQSKKERNHAYSLRAYSRFLDIDPSNLSKILSAQLSPGEKLRNKLAAKLGINSNDFMNPLSYQKTEDADYNEHAFNLFNIISDWYYYAILELIKLNKYKKNCDTNKIAKSLGLSEMQINDALKRLESVGLIQIDKKNKLIKNISDSSSSILNINTSKAHRNQQKQILEKAIDALENIPVEERSQSSVTLAIQKDKLPEALNMIKDFRRKLSRFLSESDNLDEVYNLSISLYPITTNYLEVTK